MPSVTAPGTVASAQGATDANLVRLPDEVPFDLGAMATDAGLTSYHAMVTRGGVKRGIRVGVIGLGGLGYIGARAAALMGAGVYVADVSPSARELADEIGATGVHEALQRRHGVRGPGGYAPARPPARGAHNPALCRQDDNAGHRTPT